MPISVIVPFLMSIVLLARFQSPVVGSCGSPSSLTPGTLPPPIPGIMPSFGINLTHQRLTSDFDGFDPRRNQSFDGYFRQTAPGFEPCCNTQPFTESFRGIVADSGHGSNRGGGGGGLQESGFGTFHPPLRELTPELRNIANTPTTYVRFWPIPIPPKPLFGSTFLAKLGMVQTWVTVSAICQFW